MKVDYKKAQEALTHLQSVEPEIYRRGVFVEEFIERDRLLFLGINPSFDKGDANTHIPGDKDYSPTYNIDFNHKYFNPFQKIADALNLKQPGHHDLFPCRSTCQKDIERIINSNSEACKSFVAKSLKWSEDTIVSAAPSVIIVANALAFRLFEQRHLLGFSVGNNWNDHLGVDFVELDGKKTPIFFTSMLSGQRALDLGSRTRLAWHIGFVMSNKKQW